MILSQNLEKIYRKEIFFFVKKNDNYKARGRIFITIIYFDNSYVL